MNKRFKPLTIAAPTPLSANKVDVDWKKCFICQKGEKLNLVDPRRNIIEKNKNAGYESLAASLQKLRKFERLVEGPFLSQHWIERKRSLCYTSYSWP